MIGTHRNYLFSSSISVPNRFPVVAVYAQCAIGVGDNVPVNGVGVSRWFIHECYGVVSVREKTAYHPWSFYVNEQPILTYEASLEWHVIRDDVQRSHEHLH